MNNFFDRLLWREYQRKQEASDNALERPDNDEEEDDKQDINKHIF